MMKFDSHDVVFARVQLGFLSVEALRSFWRENVAMEFFSIIVILQNRSVDIWSHLFFDNGIT